MSNPNSGTFTFSGRGYGGMGREYNPVYDQGYGPGWYGGWYAGGAGYGPGDPGSVPSFGYRNPTLPYYGGIGPEGAFGGFYGAGNENGPTFYGGFGGYGASWAGVGPHVGHGPQGTQRSDQRITEDVNDRLTQHGYLDARDIHVQVHNGEATLTGTVQSRQAKRLATDIADSVAGVQDVYNNLKITGQQSGQSRQSGAAGQAYQGQHAQYTLSGEPGQNGLGTQAGGSSGTRRP